MIEEALENMAQFQRRGSNWRFAEVLKLGIHLVDFVPLKGNSWIPLPEAISKKKAVINMKNEDDECFKWCVTRALNLVDKNAERITQKLRNQAEELNWKGLKITRIHRGIKFDESVWLKPYIMLNTDLRTNAKNDFEKDFFKLMNNSVFGKTMENIRNRVDIRLVNDRRKAEKLAAKPNFKHLTIFDEDLVSIHMKRTKLKSNKPVYCGMAILDLSKTLMYDFHYHYIKPKYDENAKLLFTDTDSLCYEIRSDDFFKDISQDADQKFDTSNYPKDYKSGIPIGKNKKVIGMMKDEAGGKIIEEFVGLRAKLYSYKMYEGKEKKMQRNQEERGKK